jgi:hypothetical protein
MIRFFGAGLLVAAVSLALAAQDPDAPREPKDVKKPAVKKGAKGEEALKAKPLRVEPDKAEPANGEPGKEDVKKDEPKKDDVKKDEKPAAPAEDPKAIIDRLKKNFNATDERLDAKDPGNDTRKLQEQIIEDLDKLLDQNDDNNGGGGGAQGGGQGGDGQDQQGNSGGKSGRSGRATRNAGRNGGNKAQNPGAGNPMGKGGGNDKKDQQAKNNGGGGQQGKDGQNGGGMGTDSKDPNKAPTVSDLHREPWGNLSFKKRQEMDAYGKDRLLPKYEQLLGEYYRTIAEQKRK